MRFGILKIVLAASIFLNACGSADSSQLSGTPEEDEVVLEMQRMFNEANAPTSSSSFTEGDYKCLYRSAISGNYDTFTRYPTVRVYGSIVEISKTSLGLYTRTTSEEWTSKSKTEEEEMIATLRLTDSGFILEYAKENVGQRYTSSGVHEDKMVVLYAICTKYE